MRKNSIDDKNYNPKPKININTQTNYICTNKKGGDFWCNGEVEKKVSRLKVAKCRSVFNLASFSKNLRKYCQPTFQTNVKSGWQIISFIFKKTIWDQIKNIFRGLASFRI